MYPSRYKILAPAAVDKAKEPKDAAAAVLESTGLDADMYRLGHTKARLPFVLSFHHPYGPLIPVSGLGTLGWPAMILKTRSMMLVESR
jgi:hypothetical protein